MTKQNKVLEALLTVRKRIETEVVTFKRLDEKYNIDVYDAPGVDRVLREEINKTIKDREKEGCRMKNFPLCRDTKNGKKLLQALQLVSSVVADYRREEEEQHQINTKDNKVLLKLEHARDIIGNTGIQGW